MKTITLLSLIFSFSFTSYCQNFDEIEITIKKFSLFLEMKQHSIQNILNSNEPNMEFMKDEIFDGKLTHIYYNHDHSCMVYLNYDESQLSSHNGTVCRQIIVSFFYPESKLNLFTKYLDSRSIFKKQKDKFYYFLGSTGPIYDVIKKQGYNIVLRYNEDINETFTNKFMLTYSIEYSK